MIPEPRILAGNISAHTKRRWLNFLLQRLFLIGNKLHQNFCRNSKILHSCGKKFEVNLLRLFSQLGLGLLKHVRHITRDVIFIKTPKPEVQAAKISDRPK